MDAAARGRGAGNGGRGRARREGRWPLEGDQDGEENGEKSLRYCGPWLLWEGLYITRTRSLKFGLILELENCICKVLDRPFGITQPNTNKQALTPWPICMHLHNTSRHYPSKHLFQKYSYFGVSIFFTRTLYEILSSLPRHAIEASPNKPTPLYEYHTP